MNSTSKILSVFVGVLLVLLAFAPARSWYGDGEEACLDARAWIDTGLPVQVVDGKAVPSTRPLMFSVSCLPSVLLAPLPGFGPVEDPIHKLIRGLTPSLWGAATAAGFFSLLVALGCGSGVAMAFALALIFSTPLWNYARVHYTDGLQAMAMVFLLRATVMAARGALGCQTQSQIQSQLKSQKHVFAAGFLVGMLFNLRATNICLIIPVVWSLGLSHINSRSRPPSRPGLWATFGAAFAAFAAGLMPWLMAWALYNQIRHGGWFLTGYEGQLFSTNLLAGLWGNLFSPGKSIFLYAPLTLMGVVASWRILLAGLSPRSHWWPAACAVLMLVVIASTWWAWHGDRAWGPRLIVPVIPGLFIPAALWVSTASWRRRVKGAALALGLAGFVLQLPVVITGSLPLVSLGGWVDQVAFGPRAPSKLFMSIPDDMIFAHYVPEFSPLVMQFNLLKKMGLHAAPFAVDPAQWMPSWRVPGFNGEPVTSEGLWPDFWFWNRGLSLDSPVYAVAAFMMLALGLAVVRRAFASRAGIL